MNRKQRRAQGNSSRSAERDPVGLHQAGIRAYRAGELAKAADLISQAIAANGTVPEFHYNLAIVQRALGKVDEAASSYQRAIALRPDHVNAHNNLGNVWKALRRMDKARASFAQALKHNPENADTHYSLGILCCEMGEHAEAERHLRNCLACDPDDSRGAVILLAHLGAASAPDYATPRQMLSLYDARSRFWDQEASYFAPALVAGALRRHLCTARADILDIGCGTGLVAPLVRDVAGRLDGVDLSPAMLEKAKAKRVYDRLFEADLAAFMTAAPQRYDALLGAATLIHFGDLKPLFEAAAACLRDKGLFVFTLFPLDGEDADYAVAASLRLAQSGCFRHSPAYVLRLAGQAGFSVAELEKVTHEHDQDGKPVAGLLAVLRRK